jgi:hypothetical protein
MRRTAYVRSTVVIATYVVIHRCVLRVGEGGDAYVRSTVVIATYVVIHRCVLRVGEGGD